MTSPAPTESRNALTPDFDAVRDKRMSELSSAQQDDARELWLRENLKSMAPYHQEHFGFLLKRLDEARADHALAMAKAAEAPPPQPTGSSFLNPTVDAILWQRFAKAFNRYESGEPDMPFTGLRRYIDELLVDVNRFLRSIPSVRPQSTVGRIAIDPHVWKDFALTYKRYKDGDTKMPFFLVREALGAVIEEANKNHVHASTTADSASTTQVRSTLTQRRP